MSGLQSVVRASRPAVRLDEMDHRLLHLLAADSRVSQRHLAREVGMSAPAVGERIARLERLGVIRGYTVSVDWDAAGLPLLVWIPMTVAPGAELADLVQELQAIPEIEEMLVTTGNYDLVTRLRLRDHLHLQEILLNRLWPIRGLARLETFLSLGEVELDGDVLQRLLPRATGAAADRAS